MLSRDQCWEQVATLMHRETGVVLSNDQSYLLEPRLQAVASVNKYSSVEKFVEAVCVPTANRGLRMALVDAMTTHESYFFRDAAFWHALQSEIFQKWKSEKKRTFRVWSAACSYGQEAYSFLMLLKEFAPELADCVQIHASDISEAALDRGRKGLYSSVEVNRGVSAPRLIRYFEKAPGGFLVKEEMRKRIVWAHENILQVSHAANQFDVVLCRNVLIYFDSNHRQTALRHLLESTVDGGYIGLGTSETLLKPQVAPGWFRSLRVPQTR